MRPDDAIARQRARAQALSGPDPLHDLPWRIHRNSIWHGWLEAMSATYPITRELVSEESFNALGRDFLLARPPSNPRLDMIGLGFADFIAASGHDLPRYLADTARLEWAKIEAEGAADSDGVPDFAAFDEAALLDAKLEPHPSLRLISSDHPIDIIHDLHVSRAIETSDHVDLPVRGVKMVIARTGFEVMVTVVDPATYSLLYAFTRGENLGAALASVGSQDEGLEILTNIIARRWVHAIT